MPLVIDNLFSREGESPQAINFVVFMVCGYIFLFIDRPWESISFLRGIPIERIYAVVMIFAAFPHQKFVIAKSPTNKWVYCLLALHFILAPFAFSTEFAVNQGIEYAKMVVLYLLLLAVADDEAILKILVKVYLLSMIFYSFHSLWEYSNGRHQYRMGISRMLGVGEAFSDPNSFGASLVLSLPIAFVLARYESRVWRRRLYYSYFPIVVLCVVLTGSRSTFVAMLFLMLLWILKQQGKRKIKILAFVALSFPVLWSAMPLEKQTRIRSIWDENAGPENAHVSAEGRKYGWQASLKMFDKNPWTGVGAGGANFIGYRISNKIDSYFGREVNPEQAHVLYGEVLAEFGIVGAFCMAGLVISIFMCCVRAMKMLEVDCFLSSLGGAIMVCLLLLLILGFAGHNFYRPLWLWLAAWSGALLNIVAHRINASVTK